MEAMKHIKVYKNGVCVEPYECELENYKNHGWTDVEPKAVKPDDVQSETKTVFKRGNDK